MEKEGKEKLAEARKKVKGQLEQLVEATGYLLEPLKKLNEEQIAAVVTLGYLVQGVKLAKYSAAKLGEEIVVRFEKELSKISPSLSPLARDSLITDRPCFSSELAYAEAMAKCEKEGKDEAHCYDAQAAMSGMASCMMKHLLQIKGRIVDILGRLKPPRPKPWPE